MFGSAHIFRVHALLLVYSPDIDTAALIKAAILRGSSYILVELNVAGAVFAVPRLNTILVCLFVVSVAVASGLPAFFVYNGSPLGAVCIVNCLLQLRKRSRERGGRHTQAERQGQDDGYDLAEFFHSC